MNKFDCFDWTSLDRYSIASYIWLLESNIVGVPITVEEFHTMVSNHLRKEIPLKFKKIFDPINFNTFVTVGGNYHYENDEQRKKCVELVFGYKPKLEPFVFKNRRFWKFCLLVADTILHEVVHMYQYRSKNFDKKIVYSNSSNVSYLSSRDEIEAYSFNIACELVEKFGTDLDQITNFLNEEKNNKRKISYTWKMYLNTFEHDHNHKVIKKLKKQIIKNIPAAEKGKPFVKSKWLKH